MAASVTASRFALLKIEGSDDEDTSKKPQNKSKDPRSKSAQKKKSRKKQNADAADLRSLAFGGGGGKAASTSSRNSQQTDTSQNQYESWAEHDKDQVDELFQQELQQAILMSKVESERQAAFNAEVAKNEIATVGQVDDTGTSETTNAKKKGKGKNKNKQKTMSIDEFQHGAVKPERVEHELDKRKVSGSGDDFFKNVETGAADIARKDKLQEEYQKQYKVQAVLQAKHNTELEARDKIIEQLKTELAESQEELNQVKLRNKQLYCILGQGEMKNKAEILQQVDSMSQIKDELTAQVTALTGELEKERSKVHALQNEVTKLKHKGK